MPWSFRLLRLWEKSGFSRKRCEGRVRQVVQVTRVVLMQKRIDRVKLKGQTSGEKKYVGIVRYAREVALKAFLPQVSKPF
jgi:hypothetical protein